MTDNPQFRPPLLPVTEAMLFTYQFDTVIPLTTIFTPPPDCLSNLPTRSANYLEINHVASPNAPALTCFPPGFPTVTYSPGLCPSGFEGTNMSVSATVTGERQQICCLSGFTVNAPYTTSCASSWTKTSETVSYVTLESLSYVTASAVLSTVNQIWHKGIVIRWRAGDFTTSLLTATAGGPNKPEEPPPRDSPGEQDSGGLSAGAKAGIGIGVAISTLLIILAVFLVWKRRKRVSNHDESLDPPQHIELDGLAVEDRNPKGLGGEEAGIRELGSEEMAVRHELGVWERGPLAHYELEATNPEASGNGHKHSDDTGGPQTAVGSQIKI
ncbi:hypothetical protein QBC44DRAFT_64012 [Cladorrhinum sp. PSN332]|nr:hypothetical protein QBC44DRAFT_64012 [Cladorrhinum sp. PSN332]